MAIINNVNYDFILWLKARYQTSYSNTSSINTFHFNIDLKKSIDLQKTIMDIE